MDERTEYIPHISQEIIKKNRCVYRLALGSDLFNKMLKNYRNSLERKRIKYTKPRKFKEDYISREELNKLIWEMPMKQIAKNLNVTTDYIKKWCKEWNILRPDPSYWPRCIADRNK